MKIMTKSAAAAMGVLLLASCGGGDDEEAAGTSSSTSEESPEPTLTTTVPPKECEEITDTFAEAILEGAPEGATPLKYVEGAAYPSPSGSGVYYVAIRFDDGQGEETGIWGATNLDTGPFRAVDGFAQEFTQWPTEDGMSIATPGAAESQSCLSGRK